MMLLAPADPLYLLCWRATDVLAAGEPCSRSCSVLDWLAVAELAVLAELPAALVERCGSCAAPNSRFDRQVRQDLAKARWPDSG